MATYAIGDLQGCYDSFQALLTKLQFNPTQDRLWLVGDLVNRGPKSLEVMQWILAHQEVIRVVLGNHDLHLIACYFDHSHGKPGDTLDALLSTPNIEAIIHWLRHQPLAHFDQKHHTLMVHAGINPHWDLSEIQAHTHWLEGILQSDQLPDFLHHMYGNKETHWHPEMDEYGLWRLYLNYFTRLRVCDADGCMELAFKGKLEDAPKGFASWFSHPMPHLDGIQILFGHWAALEGKTNRGHITGLDTGCVWGRTLTARCLETGEHISVAAVE